MTISAQTRLQSLQELIKQAGAEAFYLPTHDAFLSEYPPDAAKRLAYLTGFDGSAGSVLIFSRPIAGKPAAFFTDGRYSLQAADQLDDALYHICDVAETGPGEWLKQQQWDGTLAIDPWQLTSKQMEQFRDWEWLRLESNPVDRIWQEQPAFPATDVFIHSLKYSGQSTEKKIKNTISMMDDAAEALFVSLPDALAWLMNWRAGDVPFNPLALAYGVVPREGKPIVITAPRAIPDELAEKVEIYPLDAFHADPNALLSRYNRWQIDASATVMAIPDALRQAGAHIIERADPVTKLKSVKNQAEIEGARAAHARDGRALSAFIETFYRHEQADELQAVVQIAQRRQEYGGALYQGESFDTIAGSGPNGAIVHYRVTESSNREIQDNELFLLDSGGQYLDGTTDVTRTLIRGEPSEEMIARYTEVLKGHIALACAVFPKGTCGSQLDALARQYLWQEGLDYDHGTGHGVGSFLCVHEGPQRISKRGGDVPLQAGMILSNEPGYYKAGEFGIRIENLVLVVDADWPGFLAFETLTLAPLEHKLIDRSRLSEREMRWISYYEARVKANNAQ